MNLQDIEVHIKSGYVTIRKKGGKMSPSEGFPLRAFILAVMESAGYPSTHCDLNLGCKSEEDKAVNPSVLDRIETLENEQPLVP